MVLKKKYTVLQVLPDLNSGGVERGTLEVNKYLANLGHRSIVISNGGRMANKIEQDKGEHYKLPIGVKNIHIIFAFFKLIKFIKKNKIDIVHARSRLPAWVCYFVLKLIHKDRRPVFVTTIHGHYSKNFYSSIMTRGDKVIVVSDTIREYALKNYKVDYKKLVLNYRGVSKKDYFFEYKAPKRWLKKWYEEYPITENKKIFSLPARITGWKGQDTFLLLIKRVMKNYPNIHGLIIGDTSKKTRYTKSLRKKIFELGLEKNVSIIGHIKDIREVMSISTIVFSLSSPPEAFGRVSLESLSLGVPVIGYSHGGVKEQLQKLQPSGLVGIGNINHMEKLSYEWLKQPPKIARNNFFTLDKMLRNNLNIYKNIIQEKKEQIV